MNGADPLALRERQRLEREQALAQCAHHLNQVLGHLRAAQHYNHSQNLQLALPDERQVVDAISQCARLYQLDKEKSR